MGQPNDFRFYCRLVRYEDLLLARPETINELLAFVGLEALPYMNQGPSL